MQPLHIFTILLLVGLLLTTVHSDSSSMDINDDHALSKRIFGHHHHHHHEQEAGMPAQCVRCKFSLMRCCAPNICVKRRLRTDKCLRVKG
jgi:hypothetical protein